MREHLGKVYLVGAGPGDPGLLTLRGRECLEQADVVIYDQLANAALLAHAPRAEHIFVGKAEKRHTLLQEEIHQVILDQARRADAVVRLKGGDPFVFGRGGEEALFLAEHGVPFEVVPGVTAGIGVPAYAGIPVTHRGMALSVTLLTTHAAEGETPAVDLERLALDGTLVFYMGVKSLPNMVARLQALGRPATTPTAVIEWGTYPRQRNVLGTLGTIVAQCRDADIRPPAIVVVGPVAAMSGQINWFENRPLYGLRIVVTRAREQAGKLTQQLRELGADVFEFPTIAIVPPEDPEPFDYIGSYDWVVLTSVNGVDMLFHRLEALGHDARDLKGVKLCVIGSATADAVRRRFLRIDLMPEQYVAEDLLEALAATGGGIAGKRFLLPRADIARSFLPKELRARGGEVTELVAYRTVQPDGSESLAEDLVAYRPHLITFTSSSTARNFCTMVGSGRLEALLNSAAVATIGPITSQTAADLGLNVAVEPAQHDIPSLVEAIAAWARRRPKGPA